MALTDTQIRALKPDAKARKYSDEKGLFLLVTPTGSKLWRLTYRFDGKEKLRGSETALGIRFRPSPENPENHNLANRYEIKQFVAKKYSAKRRDFSPFSVLGATKRHS